MDYYVFKNFWKVYLAGILIILFILFNRAGLHFLKDPDAIIIFFMLLIPYYLYRVVVGHSAHKIIVDLDRNRVAFYLYWKDEPVEIDIGTLKHVRVNGYLIFDFDNRKVLYRNIADIDLLKLMNSLKGIEWGFWCHIFGPDRKTREEITRSAAG
jgi:hypothetical protein